MNFRFVSVLFLPAIAVAATPAFQTSFEPDESEISSKPFAGWSSNAGVVITTEAAFTGAHSVMLKAASDALLARDFPIPSGGNVLFIDFRLQPAAGASLAEGAFVELGASGLGFLKTAAGFQVVAFDGDGGESGRWVPIAGERMIGAWTRITIRHDYATRRWDLFLDGAPAYAGLGFFGPADSTLNLGFFGGSAGETLLDDLYVGGQPPAGVQIFARSIPAGSDTASENQTQTAESRPKDHARVRFGQTLTSTPPSASPAANLTQQRDQKLKVKLQVYSILD